MTIEISAAAISLWMAKKFEPLVEEKVRQFSEKVLSTQHHVKAVAGYIERLRKHHGTFNSFVFPNDQRRLDDFYVPLTLRYSNNSGIPDPSQSGQWSSHKIIDFPADLYEATSRILIIDTAGMGKSTVLKFLMLRQIEQQSKIPIFVELRKITDKQSLRQHIFEQIYLTSSESLPKVFDAWILKNCAFFFDGFDEVSEKKKTKIASEIVELLNASEDSQFILSSRDEPSLSALTSFSRFEISPLNRSEAEILVRKLAKNSVADALIEKIKESESSIGHFLTNPLLICLLVRAFLHSQILPRHLSEFYRQVFDALYQNHDAGKDLGGYARDKKSNLNLDSMHKVLRSLGILGYLTSALEYRRDALIKEVSAAKKLALAGEFSESEFIDDITRAVPLFVNDVTTIRWSHKSLQEYFAAAYICMDANTKQPDLLRKLSEKENAATHFNILSLVLDMDKKAFRQHVLMPAIDTVLKSSTSLWPDFAEVPDVLIAQRRGVICSNGCLVRLKEPVTRKEVISSTLIINLVSKHFPQRGCAFEMFDSQLGRTFAEDDMVTFIGAVETFEVWLPIFHLSEGARIARAPETGPVPAGMQDLLETLEPGELYVLDRTEEASLNSPALFPIGTEFAKRMTPYLSFDEVQRTAQELSNEQETAAQLISALLS